MSEMAFTPYIRKPFSVDAVRITEENLEGVIDLIGGSIEEKVDDSGKTVRFVKVDRRVIPNFFNIYPGFWLTRIGTQYQCYTERAFGFNFAIADEYTETIMEKIGVVRAP